MFPVNQTHSNSSSGSIAAHGRLREGPLSRDEIYLFICLFIYLFGHQFADGYSERLKSEVKMRTARQVDAIK